MNIENSHPNFDQKEGEWLLNKNREEREYIQKQWAKQDKVPPFPEDNCGIMSRFRKIVSDHTDMPKKFIIPVSYLIIAETIGRFYELEGLRKFRPNLFIILASAPKIGRRGTLLKIFNQVLQAAFLTYHELKDDIQKGIEELKAHQLEGGSPQGLVDEINYYKEKHKIKSYAITSSEFGKLFKSIAEGKSYKEGTDALYCKLWSGEPYTESFSRRGKEDAEPRYLPPNQYFNLLGMMQKIGKYLTNEDVAETGLARRFSIWNVEGIELVDNHKPLLGRNEDEMFGQLFELGEELGKRMVDAEKKLDENNGMLISIGVTDDAKEKINELERTLGLKAKENDEDPYSLFIQGQVDQVLKYCMNRALSRNSTTINLEDLRIALAHAKIATKPLKPIFDALGSKSKMKDPEHIKNKIAEYFNKGLTRSEVQSSMSPYCKAKEFNIYIEELFADRRITNKQLQKKS